MPSATDFFENQVLDAILGDDHAPNVPAIVYVGLFTTAPDDTGAGTEVDPATTSYDRVAVANTTANWPVAAASQKSNGVLIEFPEAAESWGTITHFGIFNAAVGGNLLLYGLLGTARPIAAGEIPQFAAGSIVITAD